MKFGVFLRGNLTNKYKKIYIRVVCYYVEVNELGFCISWNDMYSLVGFLYKITSILIICLM